MNGREISSQTSAKLMKARTQRNQIVKSADRRSRQTKNIEEQRQKRKGQCRLKTTLYSIYGSRNNLDSI